MIPMLGGISSRPTQISRISVTSISKYSANPAQTPAIFLRDMIRRSLRGAALDAQLPLGATAPAGPIPTGVAGIVDCPQRVQKRA